MEVPSENGGVQQVHVDRDDIRARAGSQPSSPLSRSPSMPPPPPSLRLHGDPFLITLVDDEKVGAVRERLHKMFPDMGAASWGVRLMDLETKEVGPLLDDDDVLVGAKDNEERCRICLVCPEVRDKYASAAARSTERAIKISR